MRVALLQYPIVWADPQANIGLLDERLRAVAGQVDLAVVPEMFSTGFCTDRPGLAEPWGGPTCRALQHMADTYNLAIAGSLMASENGKLYNRGFLFAPGVPPQLRQDKHNLYDLLICVACWPTIRIQYWDALLAARAAENHCYGIGVNMVGTDGLQLDYNGHSAAYDTWLKDLAGFEDYEEATRIVDLSIEKLRHFREVLPPWKEADEYEVNVISH